MREPPKQPGDGPGAVEAAAVEPRAKVTTYPPPFADRVAGRKKRILGELFGLQNFGVNLTLLAPGASSSLHHRHSRQDEFVYIVTGEPTLVTDTGEIQLRPGMCAGFPSGGQAHHLENRTDCDVLFLEVGDRAGGDEIDYPRDDLKLVWDAEAARRRFIRKNGMNY